MYRRYALRFAAAAIIALLAPVVARAQQSSTAVKPTASVKLFDGSSLANFDTWQVDNHDADPERVFSVVDAIDGAPAIRISGKVWGGLLTKQAYRDYRLIVEFRWGNVTWANRKTRARDSGVLLHAQGRPGNTAADFNGPWLRSIEFQIIEGGVGDILPVAGYDETGQQVRPTVTARTRRDRDGESVFDPQGEARTFSSGRINWWGRSEDWQDRLGFRGDQDVESPAAQWTHLEAVVENGNLTYYVNGKLVNAATNSSFTQGRIMLQSEGAEIYFRRVDLEPLDKSTQSPEKHP
jgi:3-keto-disaccharide hydrolase